LLFLGIYERWNESVKLFHQLYGGKMFLDELRKPFNKPKLEERKIVAYLKKGLFNDPYDSELYNFGKNIFIQKWKLLNKESLATVQS
jgi:hypothetical protein